MQSLNPARTALLIIDLQNDFLHAAGAYARGGQAEAAMAVLPGRLRPVAQALKHAGGLVAASRFTLWPDAGGHAMIAEHLHRLRPFLRDGDFAPGSRGQAVVDELADLVDVNVDKVAYSAFFNTQLDWVLRHAGIDTVCVAGIVTQGGVASTVRDAHLREYHVMVVADACAAFKQSMHDTALADLASIAELTDCARLTAALAG
ncbi:MAG: cysteine hydrolase [Burkholderiaceae bacterium]